MKKKYKTKKCWIISVGIFIFLILIISLIYFFVGINENAWVKDNRGVWIKHGNPTTTPEEVLKQEQVILCSMELYIQIRNQGINFSSQCIGACGNYSIDIVHVPRTTEDNLPQNQCQEYLKNETSNLIEMDKLGDIVKID